MTNRQTDNQTKTDRKMLQTNILGKKTKFKILCQVINRQTDPNAIPSLLAKVITCGTFLAELRKVKHYKMYFKVFKGRNIEFEAVEKRKG